MEGGGGKKLPSAQCRCADKSNRERCISTLGVEGVSYSVHGNVPNPTSRRLL